MRVSAVRKTFSGTGRTRRVGAREPNGRLQRQPRAEQAADILSFVARQPNRPAAGDIRLGLPLDTETPVLRLIYSGKVSHPDIARAELREAAERLSRDYGSYQAAIGSRRPLAVLMGSGGISADRDEQAEIDRHRRAVATWTAISRALRDAGVIAEEAARLGILDQAPDFDERLFAPRIVIGLSLALVALVGHYGLAGKSS